MNLQTKKSFSLILFLKGFSMGIADVIPGVSGGTIAFVTGIYPDLLKNISAVNKDFVQEIFKGEIRKALSRIEWTFVLPLIFGIFSAIFSMATLMHFLIENFPVYTWSFFMGLIGASVVVVMKQIDNPFVLDRFFFFCIGIVVAYVLVSLIPVETPTTIPWIMLAGFIGICAMILPGISGSFLLLVLGKYHLIISAVKAPFAPGNLEILFLFTLGIIGGLLSFSRVLNYLLSRFYPQTMAILTGFMVGAMKKVWPWKEVLSSQEIGGKVIVLQEANVLPPDYGPSFFLAVGLMILGLIIVLLLEISGKKSKTI